MYWKIVQCEHQSGSVGLTQTYSHGANLCCVPLQASDPDIGDSGRLTYSLADQSGHFDVDPSSGLVYVVSVADLAGTNATVEVKVSDPSGLQAATNVEVSLKNT